MARKVLTVTIGPDGGRDAGKQFQLTEMAATQAERFASRAFLAMARGGVEVPDDLASAGLAGLSQMGLKALSGVRWEDAEPLMDEMMTCVKVLPDPSRPSIVRGLIEDDIEEVRTRVKLRMELVKLHLDFSEAAAPSTSGPAAAMRVVSSST